MSTRVHEDPALTSEGAQELPRRSTLTAKELLREEGCVLRISEAEANTLSSQEPTDDQTMIINMGPQHPSTHGVLRLMLELDGETVLRTKPIIGYLHTGMEKTAEGLTYLQGGTNVTRMDYLSPFFNELVFSMATEQLLGIEVPPRATWIRMLMAELNRMSSHLLFLATNGMDVGAVSMLLYGWREREEVAAVLRDRHRPADEPQLHPARWCRGRPSARLARRRAPPARAHPAAARRVRHPPHRAAASSVSARRASASSPRRKRSRSASPARSSVRPVCRGTCVATCRTSRTTRSTSTSSSAATATASIAMRSG